MTMANRLAVGAMIGIACICGCSPSTRQAPVSTTASPSVEQRAWETIFAGAPVIDVRTEEEFQQGHLPDAVNIPYDQIASRVGELPADRSRPVVLYCRTGRRSGIAKQTLEGLGFTHAINAGGYDALMNARPAKPVH